MLTFAERICFLTQRVGILTFHRICVSLQKIEIRGILTFHMGRAFSLQRIEVQSLGLERILGFPVVPCYLFFFGGGFPSENGLPKEVGTILF